MYLYQRLLAEREEEERRRERPSGKSENTLSTLLYSRLGGASGDQFPGQPCTDLRRTRSYLTYGVHSRFEAMHLAHLRRRYPDQFWDLRYGRL